MGRASEYAGQRCGAMTEQARELVKRGQNDKALARYHRALRLARRLARTYPADHRPVLQQGVILRDLGGMYSMAADYQRASAVLEQSEQVCSEVHGRYGVDSGRLLAGVRVQQSMVALQLGYGASAVLTVDAALNGYEASRRASGDHDSKEMSLVLFPALIANALALISYGDADLAARSAILGWRGYLDLRDAPNWDLNYMEQAATAASGVLVMSGRLDDALAADKIAVQSASEALSANGTAVGRKKLATALAIRGLHLQATAKQEHLQDAAACLTRSHDLDPSAARKAAAEWEQEQSREAPVTLAAALGIAAELLGRETVPTDLHAALASPPDNVVSPSGRCELQLASHYAAELASLAVDLLPRSRREGLRLGLEAHYLFASAFRNDPQAGQVKPGIAWARLVLACCWILSSEPADLTLALDLAEQNLGLIRKLLPMASRQAADSSPSGTDLSPSQAAPAQVLRDCLAQHADLLAESGQPAVARQFRETAANIGSGHW